MLEFLLNVAPRHLQDARLEFAVSPLVLLVGVAAAMALALLASGYLGSGATRGLGWLRAGLAALAAVALAQPALRVPATDAASGPVVVLLDDSLSMGIADGPRGETRRALADAAFAPGSGTLLASLERRLRTRVLRFADRAVGADAAAGILSRAVSDPLGALLAAVDAGGAKAGVVLVSDGGQVRGRDVSGAITRLRAAGVAVHALGVGNSALAPDLSIDAVSAPDSVLEGDTIDLRVSVSASGLGTVPVTVAVRDDGVLVAQRQFTLAADPARVSEVIPVRLGEAGLRRIEVRASVEAAERVRENNHLSHAVLVRSTPIRVLHLEGEPRFEVKFVRRAVAGDPVLSLASLVRTGDNRYLRLGLEDPTELANGFPARAEELFRYRVLILGSLEAGALSVAQLALLERYVAERGASVLLLGGHSALSEGGYADTVLAALSPAVLEAPAPAFRTAVTARVTRAGLVHPVTRDLMALDRALPLPALAVVNPLRRLKPGASMLLAGDDGTASPLVLLAHQRFGRGKVALLAARDSWRWRMHADVALDDRVHELFWRRLLRWLARDVPGQVEVQARPSPAGPGQTVILDAQVRDAAWQPIPHARVSALLTTPLGEIRTRALAPVPGRDRGFAGAFTAAAPGAHELLVSVRAGEEDVAGSGGFLVDPHGEEFRNAGLDEALLRRIAVATGGSYRHLDSPQALAERVLATAPSGERWQRVALWNAPALLLALLALACGEWWLRRRRRLA